jgi:hypothetical protein
LNEEIGVQGHRKLRPAAHELALFALASLILFAILMVFVGVL